MPRKNYINWDLHIMFHSGSHLVIEVKGTKSLEPRGIVGEGTDPWTPCHTSELIQLSIPLVIRKKTEYNLAPLSQKLLWL